MLSLRKVYVCKYSFHLSTIFYINQAVLFRFQQKVLGPFSYDFQQNVNYVISGDNGVGKTSLLQAIKGTLPLRSGKIEFQIDDPDGIYEWKRKNIELVSFGDTTREFLNKERYYQQRFHAFDSDDLMVKEYFLNVGYDPENLHHQLIIKKCGIEDLMELDRIKLSSGQSRKYLIAKALLTDPKILLLDNPYVGLDAANRQMLNDVIDDLSGSTDMQFIIAGQYTTLPKSIDTVIELTPASKSMASFEIPKSLYSYFEDISHWPAFKTVLELRNVNVAYNDAHILKDLNWKIDKGFKCSIVGQNGSGKSTLIGLIAADHPQAYKNDISLFGKRRSNRDSIWDIKRNIGLVSSELHSYFHDPELSCFSIVKQGLYETIYNNPNFTKSQENAIDDLFTYFEIEDIKEKTFHHCSTGEQRLILFLRALIKNPPLLLLDEPFQTLDSVQVSRAKMLLEKILTQEHTLIFITHFNHEIPESIDYTLEL